MIGAIRRGEVEWCVIVDVKAGLRRHDGGRSTERAYWHKIVVLLHGAAAGLAHLHTAHIIHRDMKSVNLLLDARER